MDVVRSFCIWIISASEGSRCLLGAAGCVTEQINGAIDVLNRVTDYLPGTWIHPRLLGPHMSNVFFLNRNRKRINIPIKVQTPAPLVTSLREGQSESVPIFHFNLSVLYLNGLFCFLLVWWTARSWVFFCWVSSGYRVYFTPSTQACRWTCTFESTEWLIMVWSRANHGSLNGAAWIMGFFME